MFDLNIEKVFPDYWQGAGVSFTEYNHAVTGMGCSIEEAVLDMEEQAAEIECPEPILDEAVREAREKWGDLPDIVIDENLDFDNVCSYNTPYYYLTLRWR